MSKMMRGQPPVVDGRLQICRPIGRKIVASVSAFALALGTNGTALASIGAEGDAHMFGDLAPLNAEALDKMRGGFSVGSFNINVGVSVRTSIEGLVEVTSNFSITAPGELKNLGSNINAATKAAVSAAKTAADAAIVAAKAAAAAAVNSAKGKTEDQGSTNTVNTTSGKTAATTTTTPTDTSVADTVATIGAVADAVSDVVVPSLPVSPPQPAASITPSYNDDIESGPTSGPAVSVAGNAPVAAVPSAPKPTVQTAVTEVPSTVPISAQDVAQIVHSSGENGHTSVITNTLNNVSIQQNVSVNLSVENFHRIQTMAGVQQRMNAIAHQIGILSLRN